MVISYEVKYGNHIIRLLQLLEYADEDGNMFLLYFYGLQIVAGVQSSGICELEMMKKLD